ncbi:MAG TPA: glycosyltransferase [Gemmatimonadaceae bacterium]|nr:glycosyltransferase [Gemmatimonadaceae bacterium]
MKVLFLTHNYPRRAGDASGSFLLLLAKALRAEDVEVRVVAPASAGVVDHETVDGISVDRFHYAPKGHETLAYGGNMATQVKESWGARVKLLGFLGSEFRCAVHARRQFEPDIIHAHWWFPNGLVGTWTARMADRPLITTLHGTDVRLARSVAFSRPGFRHVLQHSAAVTAVSQFLADEAQKVVSTSAPMVAPMPVATDIFFPGGTRERNRLLFIGRLNAQKGIELLLRALAVTTTGAMLDVIGDGPDAERLKALAGELEIGDRVRWIGALPQQKLTEYYRAATALVVPSINEGLGLVAVEAQLCETPVIAFDSGGLSDVVSNGQTGILIGNISASSLAESIDTLLASPDRGAALGAAGRLHALATFAPESVARRYATLYRSVARAT